jgi:hypothetical protein
MHTGRTIEELIALVQHIHGHTGDRLRPSHDLAARGRRDLHGKDLHGKDLHHSNLQHSGQHHRERLASGRTPQGPPTTQPAWLAVFL